MLPARVEEASTKRTASLGDRASAAMLDGISMFPGFIPAIFAIDILTAEQLHDGTARWTGGGGYLFDCSFSGLRITPSAMVFLPDDPVNT
jgi:hypothetical protein